LEVVDFDASTGIPFSFLPNAAWLQNAKVTANDRIVFMPVFYLVRDVCQWHQQQ